MRWMFRDEEDVSLQEVCFVRRMMFSEKESVSGRVGMFQDEEVIRVE